MAARGAQSRPEPMNTTTHHPKVKISLEFSDPLFVAGESLTGKMELDCKMDKGLGIGVITVELFAIQEMHMRDRVATSTFMHLTRCFQGPSLPPSNAVHAYPLPGAAPLPGEHYPARRGTTTFFFRFPLPRTAPASIDFGTGLAKLRYEVRASVGVASATSGAGFGLGVGLGAWARQVLMAHRDVEVVEAAEEVGDRGHRENVVIGENGKMWVQGRVVNPYVVLGRSVCVEVYVKNHSQKKTTGLSLSLQRQLRLPSLSDHSRPTKSLEFSDTLLDIPFRGPEYIVQPGTEGTAQLVFEVPRNARGVRGGSLDSGDEDDRDLDEDGNKRHMESLFEVQCLLVIKIGMGLGNKDILLNTPIVVVHPQALRHVDFHGGYQSPAAHLFLHEGQQSPMSTYPPNQISTVHHTCSPPPLDPSQVYIPLPGQMSPITYQLYPSPPAQGHYSVTPSPVHNGAIGPVWPPIQQPYPLNMPQPYAYPNHGEHGQFYFPPLPVETAYLGRPASASPNAGRRLPPLPVRTHQFGQDSGLFPPSANNVGHIEAAPASAADGEEGKGEQAMRISRRLRQLSRNRSVSPNAHRFPAAELTPAQYFSQDASLNGGSNSAATPQQQVSLSASPAAEVLSPRPRLSPKPSFSADLPTDKQTSKSEQVAELERMAAEEVANNERARAADDKTLPRLPLTGVVDVGSTFDLGRAGELGPRSSLIPTSEPGTPRLPPQPTLAPLTKTPRPEIWDRDGTGLDALERKLLEQVGTRKPDKGSDKKADVRSVLPISIPSKNDPRCEPSIDSAISSLALGDDVPEPPIQRVEPVLSEELVRPRAIPKDGQEGSPPKRREKRRGKVSGREGRSEVHNLRKAATGRVAEWLGAIDPEEPPPSPDPPLSLSTSRTSSREVSRLRKVKPYESPPAPVRTPGPSVIRYIALEPDESSSSSQPSPAHSAEAALDGAAPMDIDPHPLLKMSPSPSRIVNRKIDSQAVATDGAALDEIPTRSSGFVLQRATGNAGDITTAAKALADHAEQARLASASPNGTAPIDQAIAEGQVRPPNRRVEDARPMKGVNGRLAVHPPSSNAIQSKYDVRSARGGRGGRVTSVAALWASMAAHQTANPNGASRSTQTQADAPARNLKKPQILAASASGVPWVPPHADAKDVKERRAKMNKSSSVPALLSSSMATPVLSSSASLARPALTPRRVIPPKATIAAIPEDESGAVLPSPPKPKPQGTREYVFGHARLKDLIKKYQQGQ